jgi:hypothetical protein
MIENKQQRPILIASFSAVLGGGVNSPIRRFAFSGVRGACETPFEPALSLLRMNCAVAQFTGHEPRFTRHCPNQSLAKQNRKPMQVAENKKQRPQSIASFCPVVCDYKVQSAQLKLAAANATAK